MKMNVWMIAGMTFLAATTIHAANNGEAEAAKSAANSAAGVADRNGCASLPGYAQLKRALTTARAAETSGTNAQQWAAIVDRNGVVCAVAFTGYDATTQLGIGRISSAMRAYSGNAFSSDASSNSNGAGSPGVALSTAQLYGSTQPGAFVANLPNSFPVNQAAAFSPHTAAYGTAADPMVGQVIGGFSAIAGGLGLYAKGQTAVGGIGVAGDHPCTDHDIAWRTRNLLGLDHLAGFPPLSGDPSRPDNIVYDVKANLNGGIGISASGLGYPMCPNFAQPTSLPPVQP